MFVLHVGRAAIERVAVRLDRLSVELCEITPQLSVKLEQEARVLRRALQDL